MIPVPASKSAEGSGMVVPTRLTTVFEENTPDFEAISVVPPSVKVAFKKVVPLLDVMIVPERNVAFKRVLPVSETISTEPPLKQSPLTHFAIVPVVMSTVPKLPVTTPVESIWSRMSVTLQTWPALGAPVTCAVPAFTEPSLA